MKLTPPFPELPRTPAPDKIESDRITLKKHQLDQAEKMFEYVDSDRERLSQFLPWVDSTRVIEDEIAYVTMTQAKWALLELFDFGIFRNADGEYLGNIGVHSLSWAHHRCELGYWILGQFEGNGYVSEAVTALEDTLFKMGFHRIEIRCSTTNQRSALVPLRCGYQLEGTLIHQLLEKGVFRDTQIFAKIRENR